MSAKENFYHLLGVSENASADEIKKAYRNIARQLHPVINKKSGATEQFLTVKEAYEVLTDPDTRTVYDQHGVGSQEKAQPVRLDIHYSRPFLKYSQEPQLIYAIIEMGILSAPKDDNGTSQPLNVALVLDTSTSMKGSRLDIVKATAIEVIRQMRANDILSIVTFNDRAHITLPASTHINLRKAESRIRGLQTRGSTEIFQGLEKGFEEVKRFQKPSYVNHIILLTDGHTYGDEKACKNLAQKAADLGIGLSSLGIGGKWNDDLLDELASTTGGSCLYVNKPQAIGELLTGKLKSLSSVYVERIHFSFVLGNRTRLKYAFRLEPEVGVLPTNSPIRLGNLTIRKRERILLEFEVNSLPENIETALLIEGEITFDIPSQATTYRIPVTLHRPVQADGASTPPSQIIADALSRLTLYRMQEKAQKDIDQGFYDQATNRLENVAKQLRSRGEHKLAETILTEAEKIESNRKMSRLGKKQIKYGTRGLLLPAGNDKGHT